MNCPNCGAAMQIVRVGRHFACPYCTSLHFPNGPTTGSDRIQPLNRPAHGSCPVCRVPLQRGLLDGVPVEHCRTCRGIFLSRNDFGEIIRQRRAQRDTPDALPSPINVSELSRTVLCPSCGTPMETHPYYGPGNVVIDTCAACASVWLDHGELTVIEQAPGPR